MIQCLVRGRLFINHLWQEPEAQWAGTKSPVCKNQKPRTRSQEGGFGGFFKPISCYPPLFFADSFHFQAVRPFCMGKDCSWICEKKTNIHFYFLVQCLYITIKETKSYYSFQFYLTNSRATVVFR
jgi:hypothetical protein